MYIYRITAIAFIAISRFWLGLAGLFALCFFANFIFLIAQNNHNWVNRDLVSSGVTPGRFAIVTFFT
jgi:hypothetical protein